MSTLFRSFRALCVIAAVYSATPEAHALDDEPVLLDSANERAEKLHRDAAPLIQAQSWQEAASLLEEAYGLKPSYDITANLASMYLELGRYPEAAQLFDEAEDKSPTGLPDEARKNLRGRAERARRQSGIVRVTSPQNVSVVIDGVMRAKLEGPEGKTVYVEPGEHRIEVRIGASRSESRVVELKAGVAEKVTFAPIDLPNPNGGDEGAETGPSPVVLGLGYGLGGAAAVVSVVLGVVASTKGNDADSKLDELPAQRGSRPCDGGGVGCREIFDLRGDQGTLSNAAIGLGIGAGVTLIGTLVYHLVTSGEGVAESPPSNGSVAVDLAPGSLRLTW